MLKKASGDASADVYVLETGDALVLFKDGDYDAITLAGMMAALPVDEASVGCSGAFVIRGWTGMDEDRRADILACHKGPGQNRREDDGSCNEQARIIPLRDMLPRALDVARAAKATFEVLYELSGSLWESGAALTGLGELDAALGGLQPGTVTVFAGHPMSGKDALVRQAAVNAAKEGSKVLLFPFGEPAEEAVTRVISSQARVNLRYLHSGALHPGDWDAIEDAAGSLSALDFRVCEDRGATVEGVIEAARRTFDGRTHGLIALTGCELMRPSSRRPQAERLACTLRALAQELNVPVVMTFEVPESCATPDARESAYEEVFALLGRLPDFAANIVLIDRPLDEEESERDPRAPMPFCARAVVQGAMPGDTTEVDLAYVSEYQRFLNLEQDSDLR